MNKLLFGVLSFIISFPLFAQSLNEIAEEKSPGWYKMKANSQIGAIDFLGNAATQLGLEQDEFKIISMAKDEIGFTHYRLQQYHKGFPVEAADFLMHEYANRLNSFNGEWVPNLSININPPITKHQAISKALQSVNAETYMWESAKNEAVIKDISHDVQATYYPKPELIIAQKDFNKKGEDYRLMYKLDVYAMTPLSRQDIYVDAHTGEVVFSLDKIHTGDVPGVAHTKYSGQQNITTDSIAPEIFRLRESTTGGGIETYNLNTTRDYTVAQDFIDSNNVWDNANAFQDEVATDAHWGAQTTYNYFLSRHNRDSYDDKGTKLLNFVHYGLNYANAFWDGQRMTYGDGNGSSFTALISLDIAAHEMTHGVTQNTAGLIYQNEWGALNESFSDIFAATTEAFGTPNAANYRVGELITSSGLGIRSMSDPKSMGDPDTYLAGLWYSGPLDNGGVHINSGVQNFWFYVLSEGDSAQNDLGNTYDVTGIGMDKAAQISYRNLAYYLTKTSEYYDARAGSIQAAEDIYGVCSTELKTVADAWHAVGVGQRLQAGDLMINKIINPNTSCGLGNAEAVQLLLRYYDCNDTLFAGDSISAGLSFNNTLIASNDYFVLAQNMLAGDSLLITFNQTVDLSAFGFYTFKAWINHSLDQDQSNDTIFEHLVKSSLQQNSDIAIVDLHSPFSGCELTNSENIEVSYQFLGCDSISGSSTLKIGYCLNNGTSVSESFTLVQTLFPGDIGIHTFSNPIDLSAKGQYKFDVWVEFPNDPDNSNDSILTRNIQNPYPVAEHLYTFENRDYTVDSMYFRSTSNSRIDIVSAAADTDTLGLRMTGSNPIEEGKELLIFSRRNPWDFNPSYSSFACACVDARDWDSVKVSFDLKQTFSNTWIQVLGRSQRGVSSFRVTVDGVQFGETFQPITNKNDRFRLREFNLSQNHNHSQFELCLEARNYLAEEFDPTPNNEGDNAYIDNFRIYNDGNISLPENISNSIFEIYPNPSKGIFNIKIDGNTSDELKLEILNGNGQILKSLNVNESFNEGKLILDLHELPKGLYFLKIGDNTEKLLLGF